MILVLILFIVWESMNQKVKKYAGLWSRFLALMIDFFIFCAIFFPVTRIVKGVWVMSASDHRWGRGLFITDPLCIAFLVFMFLYFIFLEGLAGATLGKFIIGLRVIDTNGKKPGLLKSLLRNILRLIDSPPTLNILGIILIIITKENTRFGDMIAKTRVVKVQ
jgi:uncharacterized RDD family membrane protein YckC